MKKLTEKVRDGFGRFFETQGHKDRINTEKQKAEYRNEIKNDLNTSKFTEKTIHDFYNKADTSTYYPEKKQILLEELNNIDTSGLAKALITAERSEKTSILYFEPDEHKQEVIKIIEDVTTKYVKTNPEVHDLFLNTLGKMAKGAEPRNFNLVYNTAKKAYDNEVFEGVKSILTESRGFGPYTSYICDGAIDVIIDKTFDKSTPMDLRKKGVNFLISELGYHIENIPENVHKESRNAMYVDTVAKVLIDNMDDPLVSEHYTLIKDTMKNTADKFEEHAKMRALHNTGNLPDGLKGKKLSDLIRNTPTDVVYKDPTIGLLYDKAPALEFNRSRTLYGMLDK